MSSTWGALFRSTLFVPPATARAAKPDHHCFFGHWFRFIASIDSSQRRDHREPPWLHWRGDGSGSKNNWIWWSHSEAFSHKSCWLSSFIFSWLKSMSCMHWLVSQVSVMSSSSGWYGLTDFQSFYLKINFIHHISINSLRSVTILKSYWDNFIVNSLMRFIRFKSINTVFHFPIRHKF